MNDLILANNRTAYSTASYYDERLEIFKDSLTFDREQRINVICRSLMNIERQIENPKILDLGCGSGWMAPYLNSFGQVTGVDFSPKCIDFAKSIYGDYASYFLADPYQIKLGLPESAEFDVVVCSEVLEHTDEPQGLLHQISLFLGNDGYCIVTTPNGNLWGEYSSAQPAGIGQLQIIENWLTPNQLYDLLLESGYSVHGHEGIRGLGYPTGYKLWLHHPRIESFTRRLNLSAFRNQLVLGSSLYQLIVGAVQR